MAELFESPTGLSIRIIFSYPGEAKARGFEKYFSPDDLTGTNLEKDLKPRDGEILYIDIPEDVNPETYWLYIASYNPKRSEIPRDLPSKLLIDLIHIFPYHNDLQPLYRLGNYLNRPGDAYFWLYLAEQSDLFLAQLNDTFYQEEMARIEDLEEKEPGMNILREGKEGGRGPPEGKEGKERKRSLSRERKSKIASKEREVKERKVEAKALENVDTLQNLSRVDLRYSPINIRNTLAPTKVTITEERIRRNWSRKYTRLNVGLLGALENEEKDLKVSLGEAFAEEFRFPRGIPYLNYLNGAFDLVNNILNVPGVAVCGGFPAHLVNPSFRMKAQNEYVRGFGNIYTHNFVPRDIDIFLHGDVDIKETVDHLLRVIPQAPTLITPHSISINTVPRVQIIKRLYRNVTQILSGFDLDSSACAMIKNQQGNIQFYGTDRFIKAVKYGINVVNPFRQSTTFNYRLKKYAERGYFPYIAGQMHLRFDSVYMNRVIRCDKGKHTFPDLLRKCNNEEKKERELSDYDTPDLGYVFTEVYEAKRDITGPNRDLLEDIFRDFKESQEYKELGGADILQAMDNFILTREYPVKVMLARAIPLTVKYLYLGWLLRRPGRQSTGSFHPTFFNYFGPDPEDLVRKEMKRRNLYEKGVTALIEQYAE